LERNPDWHAGESPWKAGQIAGMLVRNQLLPRSISEVGCGAGEVLKRLQEHMADDCEFRGYEISPVAYELCRAKANDRLQFKLADFTRESVIPFDLILVLDIIEHLEDYFSSLRAIQPKGAYKIFHIPLDLSVQTVLRSKALIKRRDQYAHVHFFTKDLALRGLQDAG
jgi:cyclopropane fatty-acyl-phospholipid synthase-like methyltransferase